MYVMRRQNSREQSPADAQQFPDELPAWSPDGAWLVYTAQPDSMGDFDLYTLAVDGDHTHAWWSNGRAMIAGRPGGRGK